MWSHERGILRCENLGHSRTNKVKWAVKGGNCWSKILGSTGRDGVCSTQAVGSTTEFRPVIHSNERKSRLTMWIQTLGKRAWILSSDCFCFLPINLVGNFMGREWGRVEEVLTVSVK